MLSMDTKHAMAPRPPSRELPPIDARLIAPGSGYELYDGELAHVPPAGPPHATRHSKLSALVESHASADFEVASDLLTRASEISDVAPDVSIYPHAKDPVTGGRQLEQLAFEIVSTERLGRASRKAGMLADRGVRRLFAIDVEHERALEWSRATRDWEELDPTGQIEDPALAVPLPIAEMLTSASADDAMARALIAKGNPEIETVRAKDRLQTAHRLLLVVLVERGIRISPLDRNRMLNETDLGRLERWTACAARCEDIAELFAVP